MRSTSSVKNAIIAILMNIVTILMGFFAQRVFINILGTEYLGISGLFSNILSMLAIVELGLGSAIVYHLYKPIADQDIEKIKSLMQFYKIGYRIIALIVAVLGLLIIPFLSIIVGEVTISENIIFIYILFLIDIVASYLLSYKRSILYADQKTYIINLIHIIYLITLNITQILILIFTENFILYLLIKITFRVLENIIITIIANKKYPYIKDGVIRPLGKEERKSIFSKIKGLIYHKVASFVVSGTDNIIISIFLGVATVGLYSNYNLIIQALNSLFSQVFNSITASVGNLLVEKNEKKSYRIYRNVLFVNSWIFAFASTGLICVTEPFIKVWIGDEYILPFGVLIALVANFYVQGMRKTANTFKEAAGVFYEDRHVPIMESVINIVASVIFVKIFGLAGVFIGTITSAFIIYFYSYPKFVYKPLFHRSYLQYIREYIPYVLVAIIAVVITRYITESIYVNNNILQILINVVLVCIVPNVIYLVVFHKTEEFGYFRNILKNFIKAKKKL